MSLFAGTSFMAPGGGKRDAGQEAPERSTAVQTTTRSNAPASTAMDARPEAATATAPLAPKNPSSATPGPSNWSAALRFAPAAASRKPKPAATSSTKPSTAFLPSGFKPAALSSSTSSAASTSVPLATSVTFSAAPTRLSGSSGDAPGPSFKAPAMTLEEPAGGLSKAGTIRRAGTAQNKRRRKRAKLDELLNAPVHVFEPLEAYDPSKPNDLQEYRDYRKAVKEEARQRRRQEREREEEAARRRSDRYGSVGTNSSDYETDEEEEEEERPRRDAPRAFAPPTSLYAPSSNQEEATTPPVAAAAAPPAPAFTEAPALSTEEAQTRRAAMAQSAEDAYARRVAMSAGRVQGHAEPVSAMPPAAPPMLDPQPSTSSADTPRDYSKLLAERKAAAAAIAAKLAAFKAPEAPVTPEDDAGPVEEIDPDELLANLSKEVERDATSTFAKKMMRKWGHQEGTGLGSRGDGIVHALSAEHAKGPGAGSKQNDSKRGWVHSTSAMGRLVNLNENEQRKADTERYGEPSEVVCLRNVVAGAHEIDDSLADEIAEECNKNGVVDKVVVHVAPVAPSQASDQVRIFVRFTGLAGAWRTVKEMDGRFFGGRQLRATYYPLIRFERNEKDMPLMP